MQQLKSLIFISYEIHHYFFGTCDLPIVTTECDPVTFSKPQEYPLKGANPCITGVYLWSMAQQ